MTQAKHHILIVDDEPLNRDLLRRVLQSNYELSEAAESSEALEILESEAGQSIGLVLCDYLMPGRTGAELAVIVGERWPNITFMLITGYEGDEEVQRVQDEGIVYAVLSKPWRSQALRESVAKGLE